MMSNAVISLFAGIGTGAWIYNYMYRRTGGDTRTTAIIAGVSGVLVFITMLVVLAILF